MFTITNIPIQVGIASYAKTYCGVNNPAPVLFTNVGYFRNWINESVKKLIYGGKRHPTRVKSSSSKKFKLILEKFHDSCLQ